MGHFLMDRLRIFETVRGPSPYQILHQNSAVARLASRQVLLGQETVLVGKAGPEDCQTVRLDQGNLLVGSVRGIDLSVMAENKVDPAGFV